MNAVYANGMKYEGEIADLMGKGATMDIMVRQKLAEPKKYQVIWKEWSYQDNCEYSRNYSYDSHEEALAVQDFIVKVLRHFAIVKYNEGEVA